MAIDRLLGATVRIRSGWHGGRIGEVVAFDRRAGPPSTYSEIKVKLNGSGQLVTIYSLDQLERLSDLPGVTALSTTPPELL
jgi:hypothetical protein